MTSVFLTSGWAWYDQLISPIPHGKLFSWHAVFDAIPNIIQRLPITLGLTLAGAVFGLILALIFAIVKINKVKILYPIQAVFVSFLRGTPILVQLMLTYYGIPLFSSFSTKSMALIGILMPFQLPSLPLQPLLLMKQPMRVRLFVQLSYLLTQERLKLLKV